ncbi:MAG: glycosyltransferase [Candidatus Methylacidiphilales bacterium]|nr:glycosyltransferase [Candidatus Methylacidiphilales bacterium]
MISVVLPAYNEADQLPQTLGSIHQAFQALAQPVPYEIVVCDNNSTDDTRQVAEAHGARVVFEPHNQIARARNTGARLSTGEWLIFLDADTRLPASLLAEMWDGIAEGRFHGGGAPVRFDTARLRPGPALVLALWNTVSRLAKLAAGSFIFCRRADWELIGGFDETFYAGEELQFSAKMKKHLAQNQRKFAILSTSVPTSARKIEWNSDWQLLRLIPLAFQPSAWKKRESCGFWYQRPPVE